jgi:hypothetical protein
MEEVPTPAQTRRCGYVLKMPLLRYYPIQVERQLSLNYFPGFVTTFSIHGMLDEIKPWATSQCTKRTGLLGRVMANFFEQYS